MQNNKAKRNPSCKFTIEVEQEILKDYESGLSLKKVGEKHSCDATTVSNILKAYNIERRNLSQARRNFLKYTLNEDSFEIIDSEEKAYWLGVMYSDGYIVKTEGYTNSFGLTVSTKDIKWLYDFRTFLGYNGNVNSYMHDTAYAKNTEYSRLKIGNNKVVQDLESHGVVANKTKKIEEIPEIPNDLVLHFIRGYVDGDGSLGTKNPQLQISGNKNFLEDIASYFGMDCKIYVDKSIFSLKYNRKESRKIEKLLYQDSKISLERKYNIAKRSFTVPLVSDN